MPQLIKYEEMMGGRCRVLVEQSKRKIQSISEQQC
jgi:hypothetical protein